MRKSGGFNNFYPLKLWFPAPNPGFSVTLTSIRAFSGIRFLIFCRVFSFCRSAFFGNSRCLRYVLVPFGSRYFISRKACRRSDPSQKLSRPLQACVLYSEELLMSDNVYNGYFTRFFLGLCSIFQGLRGFFPFWQALRIKKPRRSGAFKIKHTAVISCFHMLCPAS